MAARFRRSKMSPKPLLLLCIVLIILRVKRAGGPGGGGGGGGGVVVAAEVVVAAAEEEVVVVVVVVVVVSFTSVADLVRCFLDADDYTSHCASFRRFSHASVIPRRCYS
ncbi:hypothetical protein E2C01_030000 [Portunus trituberculatus]|uniref:Uncharacterized protein n=1 Tax=Portunus trituberculatus TaxID=210409 RepID=A0A5B7ETI8_PORTR|nr:hypothetical protein [Portunus trituberculatus]